MTLRLVRCQAANKVDGLAASMQHAGITAVESLSGEKKRDCSAFLPSLEAAWRVGHPVVEELLEGWSQYADTLPEPGQSRVSR